MDIHKIRRETMRWQILLCLNTARPLGCMEALILSVVQSEFPDASQMECRRELQYLAGRELVTVKPQPDGRWHVDITRFGIDLVEYTIDCEPGISRPEKYC